MIVADEPPQADGQPMTRVVFPDCKHGKFIVGGDTPMTIYVIWTIKNA